MQQVFTKPYCMLTLFRQFIKANKSGNRLQKNGNRIRSGTIKNYENVYTQLENFSKAEEFELRIVPTAKLKKNQFKTEQIYWKSFYSKFTTYLFSTGVHDNYVGSIIKNVRVFFNHVEQEKNISISQMHKSFYVAKTEPPIFTLDAGQLQFLIHDQTFEIKLDEMQKLAKDIFIFGATSALRMSDLMNLKMDNLIDFNGCTYLRTHSIKTNTFTQVKLPDYALNILERYKGKRKRHVLPFIYLNTFNNHLKEIGELAGWTQPVEKHHYKRGEIANKPLTQLRFCDVMSSHMMRKTAITNMLVHKVDENVVRKISGHAAGSKEFYRYVSYSQTLIDAKTDVYFNALNNAENYKKC